MRSLLLLPLLCSLLVFGCSQNPHVDIASSPVHATSANAQRTEPGLPDPVVVTPPPVDPTDEPPVEVGEPDRDGDGVPDQYDHCPDVPGPVFNDGCPLDAPPADSDHDGVPDIYDKCPEVPGPVFNDGCPLRGPSRPFPPAPQRGCPYPGGDDDWHRVVLEMKESLKFDFDRFVIKPESYPALRHLTAFLERYPMSHLYMVGHTDDVGTDEYNMWLSRARVFAVKDFLVKAGIPEYRVSVDARGKREPLVNVAGKEGSALDWARAMNRRVDLEVRYEKIERR
jgi:OOP family OmpA-OmpF porin